MSDDARGLYDKYRVERLGDPAGKHAGCRFFVLDPQHDPIAREVLRGYVNGAYFHGHTELARDLLLWLRELEKDDEHTG